MHLLQIQTVVAIDNYSDLKIASKLILKGDGSIDDSSPIVGVETFIDGNKYCSQF